MADGADHWFCFYFTIPPSDRQPYVDAMSYLDDRTDMFDVETSCGSSTDVVYGRVDNLGHYEGPVWVPERGRAPCVAYVIYAFCDQAWELINYAEIAANSAAYAPGDWLNFGVNLIKTIRHETGHTAGLGHPVEFYDPLDAMVWGWVITSLYPNWWSYGDHNRDHINGFY